jgi:hypothetical protein
MHPALTTPFGEVFIVDEIEFIRDPVERLAAYGPPRFGEGAVSTGLHLGPLASLAGTWQGNGFNAIWRPHNPASPPLGNDTKRFLELNMTTETIDFHVIPGVVPNRGLNPVRDLNLYGLHYLQRVSDADLPPFSTAGQALHIEPSFFMRVPATHTVPADANDPPLPDPPPLPSTIVRLASIPHGVSVLMQGPDPGIVPTPNKPVIPPIFPIVGIPPGTAGFPPGLVPYAPPAGQQGLGIQPFDIPPPDPPGFDGAFHSVPENINVAADGIGSLSNGPYIPNPAVFQDAVNDPNSVLRNAIAGQNILGFIQIDLSTQAVNNSIGNIPFLGIPNPVQPSAPTNANAFVYAVNATFWIEWVRMPGEYHHYPDGRDHGDDRCREIEPYLGEPTYLQLQYSQVVILIFNNVLWPHVTVATLTLSAG